MRAVHAITPVESENVIVFAPGLRLRAFWERNEYVFNTRQTRERLTSWSEVNRSVFAYFLDVGATFPPTFGTDAGRCTGVDGSAGAVPDSFTKALLTDFAFAKDGAAPAREPVRGADAAPRIFGRSPFPAAASVSFRRLRLHHCAHDSEVGLPPVPVVTSDVSCCDCFSGGSDLERLCKVSGAGESVVLGRSSSSDVGGDSGRDDASLPARCRRAASRQ